MFSAQMFQLLVPWEACTDTKGATNKGTVQSGYEGSEALNGFVNTLYQAYIMNIV